MKLADTYTNLCFIALVIHISAKEEGLPIYIVIISSIAMGMYVMLRSVQIGYLFWYIQNKIVDKVEEEQIVKEQPNVMMDRYLKEREKKAKI
jgi:hypothetical protein